MKCMHCESDKVIHKRLPEHRREWTEGHETFTEYMPAADDFECVDCQRIWTIFDGEPE